MNIKPAPHPLKAKLRKAKVSIADTAAFCGTALSWMTLILNGYKPANEHISERLAELERLIDNDE